MSNCNTPIVYTLGTIIGLLLYGFWGIIVNDVFYNSLPKIYSHLITNFIMSLLNNVMVIIGIFIVGIFTMLTKLINEDYKHKHIIKGIYYGFLILISYFPMYIIEGVFHDSIHSNPFSLSSFISFIAAFIRVIILFMILFILKYSDYRSKSSNKYTLLRNNNRIINVMFEPVNIKTDASYSNQPEFLNDTNYAETSAL
jgi:hypothetical protein